MNFAQFQLLNQNLLGSLNSPVKLDGSSALNLNQMTQSALQQLMQTQHLSPNLQN
jgi:hypothetical protein